MNICENVIYFCHAKLNFHHHYSSLQCHIIQTLFIIINIDNSCVPSHLCGHRSIYLKKINIINVFAVTFDQFNASLLNMNIAFCCLV